MSDKRPFARAKGVGGQVMAPPGRRWGAGIAGGVSETG